MSHFGRSGPPDIRDTYSLLVLNISFRTSADDLFPLFGRYGKVVDIFIPRDRRSGDSRGFAFVRYKHSDEAQKAVERLDGKNVDGRNISVEFAKYGRDMETIHKGRITRENFNWKRSRSRSPKRPSRTSRSPKRPSRRYREDYKESNHYQGSRINDRHDQDRHARHDRSSHRRHPSRSWSASRSRSPVRMREGDRMREDNRLREDDRRNPRGRTPDRKASPYSSRDTSPRKRSLSPVPDSHSPEASVSPVERRASPKMQNGSQQADQSRSGTSEPHSRSLSQNTDAEDQ